LVLGCLISDIYRKKQQLETGLVIVICTQLVSVTVTSVTVRQHVSLNGLIRRRVVKKEEKGEDEVH